MQAHARVPAARSALPRPARCPSRLRAGGTIIPPSRLGNNNCRRTRFPAASVVRASAGDQESTPRDVSAGAQPRDVSASAVITSDVAPPEPVLPFSLTFQRGDPIPMMNRTQYAAQRSRWTEVPLGVAPRFGIDERLLLPPVHGVGYGEDFKVSFALLGLQFITPWFTVVDDAHSLSRVELTLRAAGDTVISAQWLDEYTTDAAARPLNPSRFNPGTVTVPGFN